LFRNGVQIATPTSAVFTDQGLTPNTSYSYTVAAVDSSNNVSAVSAAGVHRTLADTIAPSIPANVTGVVTGGNIALSWTAASDNIAVSGYLIYRDGVLLGASPTTSFNVVGALSGTHVYSVAAVDAADNKSAQSVGTSISIFAIGDINRDGKVDVFDLSSMLANWGRTGVNVADLNADSVVNVFDLSILLGRWTG
jgi:chitodextrinase